MDRWGQVAPGPRQPPLGGLQNTPRWVIVGIVSVEDHPVQIAVVDDYDVVVAGVANMLEPYRDRVVVAELDTGRPVKDDVDIALYDSFAQPESDHAEIKTLIDNPRAERVVGSWAQVRTKCEDFFARNGIGATV